MTLCMLTTIQCHKVSHKIELNFCRIFISLIVVKSCRLTQRIEAVYCKEVPVTLLNQNAVNFNFFFEYKRERIFNMKLILFI